MSALSAREAAVSVLEFSSLEFPYRRVCCSCVCEYSLCTFTVCTHSVCCVCRCKCVYILLPVYVGAFDVFCEVFCTFCMTKADLTRPMTLMLRG